VRVGTEKRGEENKSGRKVSPLRSFARLRLSRSSNIWIRKTGPGVEGKKTNRGPIELSARHRNNIPIEHL